MLKAQFVMIQRIPIVVLLVDGKTYVEVNPVLLYSEAYHPDILVNLTLAIALLAKKVFKFSVEYQTCTGVFVDATALQYCFPYGTYSRRRFATLPLLTPRG